MQSDQQKAMFANMRQNAVEMHPDMDGVFHSEIPQTEKRIILQRIYNHAEEMKDKDRKYRESEAQQEAEETLRETVEDAKKNPPTETEQEEYSFVTLEDGTSVRWTPELEKTLLKIQNERFANELKKEYGLEGESDFQKIQRKVANKAFEKDLETEYGLTEQESQDLKQDVSKISKRTDVKGLLNDAPINENFNSSVIGVIHG